MKQKITKKSQLVKHLNNLCKGGVKYFMEGEDTVFTYRYKDVAVWLYNEDKAIIY